MIKGYFKNIIFVAIFLFLFFPLATQASQFNCYNGAVLTAGPMSYTQCESTCLSAGYRCVEITNSSEAGPVNLENPAPGLGNDPNKLIGYVINAILGLVGSLALVMFIYGGLTWMLAGGSREKVQKGKDVLLWATIGLIVIFASYAIVFYILENTLAIN
jgi:hypothetical protein